MADGIMSTSSAPVVNAVAASADQPDLRMTCEITFHLSSGSPNTRPCRPPEKGGDGKAMIQRLYLTDKTSSSRYLIDTGADVSQSAHKTSGQTAQMQLFAANGTAIPTYGKCLFKLDLGLRREFNWPSVIAAVSQPIIGADFLRHFDF
ncbi:retrovirus-related Pol polyprotein from transposon 297 [Caerostris extrusa]|uniref:Retrovirus-related Pol polyprotein from transposon 297 n=1 Tax=Caerostris extrusa TaxID=172846 RepID=A0AAV4TUE8_CAEEX|nr:retrovirus-related Pol polyprotein from transposon 297 [Caerostris extrusa]